MNNVIKFSYFYFPYSKDILFINIIGKLIFKFIFYCKYRSLKYDSEGPRKFNFVNNLTETFTETQNENGTLSLLASVNRGFDCQTETELNPSQVSMRNPWSVIYSYIFDFFEYGTTVSGVSIENDVFIIRNQPVRFDKISRRISNSMDIIFDGLVNKFYKLLFCPEIVDLIIEKNVLKTMNVSVIEKTEEIFVDKVENNYNSSHDSNEKTESITSFTIISSGKVTIKDNKFEFKALESTDTDTPDWQISEIECQAAGDTNIFQTSSNFIDEKFNNLSRISKAQDWLKSNQSQSENSQFSKSGFKSKKFKQKSSQNKQKKSLEKSKLPRFIVKKSDLLLKNSTNNSSTNLVNAKRPNKLRFTVLKTKSGSKDHHQEIVQQKSKFNNKSFRAPKFTDTNILSSIRQDVLNLANELHQNYLRHSKSILANGKGSIKKTNKEKNDNAKKEDFLLEEVKRRLQHQPKFRKSNRVKKREKEKYVFPQEYVNLDTLNGMKSINSVKQDTNSYKCEGTMSMFSSSNNPFNSSFLTASDNSVTSYKSFFSNTENSACLNSLDLRDIHLISDEIHDLAQKELLKI